MKTGSLQGNLVSEFSQNDNMKPNSQVNKAQLQDKIILNSIININITNINHPLNNKQFGKEEKVAYTNGTLTKTR